MASGTAGGSHVHVRVGRVHVGGLGELVTDDMLVGETATRRAHRRRWCVRVRSSGDPSEARCTAVSAPQ